METITIVSLMAENARFIYQGVAEYLGRAAGVRATLVTGASWQEQERMLDQSLAEVGFICGLLYARKAGWLDLLAAPIMQGLRYAGRPIYFSDVVVHRDSAFQSFADLRGAAWAYNDPGSFSGYAALLAYLAALGETPGYFGRLIESGGHLRSLRLVAEGLADAAAIDSVVLDLELKLRPELAGRLRVVEAIGPSAIPPAVVARRVPEPLARRLREALLRMHLDDQGRAILGAGQIARFVEVGDADYDDVRRKARSAKELNVLRAI